MSTQLEEDPVARVVDGAARAIADEKRLLELLLPAAQGQPPVDAAGARALRQALTASAHAGEGRFGTLARAFSLDEAELAVLGTLLVPTLDERVARRLRELQGDYLARVPSAWFLVEVLAPSLSAPPTLGLFADEGRLLRHRLVRTSPHPDRPTGARAHAMVELDPDVAEFLVAAKGGARLSRSVAEVGRLVGSVPDFIAPPEGEWEPWLKLGDLLVAGQAPRVVLVGSEGRGKKTIAAELASSLDGQRLLVIDLPSLHFEAGPTGDVLAAAARDAKLHHALLALDLRDGTPNDWRGDLLPWRRAVDEALAHHHDPVFLLGRSEGAAALLADARAIEVRLPPLDFDQQLRHLRRAIAAAGARPVDDALLRAGACQAGLTPGAIDRAVGRAVALARLDDLRHPNVQIDELRSAVRQHFGDRFFGIAQRVTSPFRMDDLVVPSETEQQLREMVAYVRNQNQVFDLWGFAAKVPYGRAISALFAGPPGTGKTMAAGVIAGELGLDLYRIDLSQVVSKYIGETEKKLGQVFDRAEETQAIILFDEADALFGKRTESKSANDRYANLEVNYLLQRIETFRGIAILTTNFEKGIDEAFRRRLRFIVEFPFPTEEERVKLWQTMIPAGAELRGEVPWERLARFEMAGGNIKNAILRAAFAAAARTDAILPYDLLRAAVVEQEKMGKLAQPTVGLFDGLEEPGESSASS